MVDGTANAGPVNHGEPRAAVGDHGALEGVDTVGLAQVGLGGRAVGARSTFPGEDWDHMVPRCKVLYSVAHALYHSVCCELNYVIIILHTKRITDFNERQRQESSASLGS